MTQENLDNELAAAAAEVGSDGDNYALREACLKLLRKQRELELARAAVAALEEEVKNVAEREVPDAFAAAGVTKLVLSNGVALEVKPFSVASIKVEDRPAAHAWLRSAGAGDLIKHDVVVNFAAGEEEHAQTVYRELRQRGLQVDDREGVNYQTLNAWVRRRLEAGVAELGEGISLYRGQVAKVTLPEKKTLADVLRGALDG